MKVFNYQENINYKLMIIQILDLILKFKYLLNFSII